MKIVVTGSLGHIGKPLTEELVQKGHSVTVISSNPEKQKDIEALGATAAIGSVEDINFLTRTFTGADAIHAMIPPNFRVDPIVFTKNVADAYAEAIERAGVKRVVYVSSYGAELEKGSGLIYVHNYAEKKLNAIPTLEALTHLRATYIYYNLFRFVDMIKAGSPIMSNYGEDDLVVLVAPQDIAAAAADELENQTAGQHVRYAASDERTCNEIAHALGTAIGKPGLKWDIISDEQLQNGMEAEGMPPALAAQMVEMFAACHTGLLHHDYDKHKPALGKVKLADFAKEFAAVYNQKQ